MRREAKVQKVTRDTETLEESKDSFRSIFKGLHRDRISKGRRKKENRRKSNARKKKRFENNVQRVYSICVGNPLGNDLPKCLLYPPCLAVPEGCIDVETKNTCQQLVCLVIIQGGCSTCSPKLSQK